MRLLTLLSLLLCLSLPAVAQSNAPPELIVDGNGSPLFPGTGVSPPQAQAPSFTCVTRIAGILQYCANSGGGGSGGIFTDLYSQQPVADVVSYGTLGTTCTGGSEDDTAALQAAINANAGTPTPVRVSGTCRISSQITLPTGASGSCEWHLVGASQNAQIQAISGFPANTPMLLRPTNALTCPQASGIDGLVINANQIASAALQVQQQRILNLNNLTVLDATGGTLGAEVILGVSGGSSLLVGLNSYNLFIDNSNTIFGSGGAAARPNYGMIMYQNVDDSQQYDTTIDHVKIAGIQNFGTNNTFTGFHPFGFGPGGSPADTWPNFGLEDHSFASDVVAPEFDTMQFGGVDSINGFIKVLGGKLVCNDGGTGSACAPFVVQAESGASNIFLYGTVYQAGSLSAPNSPINWIGTPDATNSTYITQWGVAQLAGRSGLHLGTGANRTTADSINVTGTGNFTGGIQSNPLSTATSGANVLPSDQTNTASIWNGTAGVGATWNQKRFTSTSGVPTFDQLLWAAPSTATYPGTGNRQFGIADLSQATASNNYIGPDWFQQGACYDGTQSQVELWFWRMAFGTGANPTETLNLFNTARCSGAKNISALFQWNVTSLIATATIQTTNGVFETANGSTGTPSYTSSVDTTTGFHFPATGQVALTVGGFDQLIFASGQTFLRSNMGFRWNSAGASSSGNDTGISRSAAGVVSIDTTTSGNGLGTAKAAAYTTTANCSSSASPAVCAAASSGSVSVAAGTNPTLVVDTTAVTANSQILLQDDESLGTKLSVTCSTTITSGAPLVTARTAGTSFTIEVPGTFTTNPVCMSYHIVN